MIITFNLICFYNLRLFINPCINFIFDSEFEFEFNEILKLIALNIN